MSHGGHEDSTPDINIDIPSQVGEIPLSFNSLEPLLQKVDVYKDANEAFLTDCQAYAEEPSDVNQKNLGLTGTLLIKAFRETLNHIKSSDCNTEARIKIIASLLEPEAGRRYNLFSTLAPCPGAYTEEDNTESTESGPSLEEDLYELAQTISPNEFYATIYEQYADALSNDVNHFAEHITENYVPPSEKRIRAIAREIGHHALDVGKTALGTAIGALGVWAVIRQKR